MKLIAYLIATLALFCSVLAVDQQISVLVTYPDDTADHIVDEAKQAIVNAGGVITHEYNLIKYDTLYPLSSSLERIWKLTDM